MTFPTAKTLVPWLALPETSMFHCACCGLWGKGKNPSHLSVWLLLKPALPCLLELQQVLGPMEGLHVGVAGCQLLPVAAQGAAQLQDAPAAHQLSKAIIQCFGGVKRQQVKHESCITRCHLRYSASCQRMAWGLSISPCDLLLKACHVHSQLQLKAYHQVPCAFEHRVKLLSL